VLLQFFASKKGFHRSLLLGGHRGCMSRCVFLACTLRNFGFGLREIKPTEMNGTKKLVTVLGLAYEELQI